MLNFFKSYKNHIYFHKKNKVNSIIIIAFIHIVLFFELKIGEHEKEKIKYQQDEITIVTAYYRIKSKHKPKQYLDWIKNFVLLNRSMVFFTNKKLINHIKSLRPKKFNDKTVFLEVEIEEFYAYKNFINDFIKTFEIDFERKHHTIPLYLIWAEKCSFMKKAITYNFFNSTCFYWIDAGYFRKKSEMVKYSNNWPSTKKCFEEKRLLMGQIKNFSNIERRKIINFDIQEHIKLRKEDNVIGGIFGGQNDYILRFIYLYYKTLKLFVKKKMFIGKDQNIFTYIALSNPKIVKLVKLIFIFCR